MESKRSNLRHIFLASFVLVFFSFNFLNILHLAVFHSSWSLRKDAIAHHLQQLPPLHEEPQQPALSSPPSNLKLRAPPPLKNVLGNTSITEFEQDFEVPHVYVVAGMRQWRPTVRPHDPTLLLYVFAQGTIRYAPAHRQRYVMEITGCQVGDKWYPLLTSTSGAYCCELPKTPASDTPITLTVSQRVFIMPPRVTSLARKKRHALIRQPNGSYHLRSSAVWTSQVDAPATKSDCRYEVCLMTQEQTFPELLPDWITYHRKLGVDRVYIYDNNHTPTIGRQLSALSDVEVVHWPYPRSQFQAQTHFLLLARRRCTWAILIDVDERIVYRPAHVAWSRHNRHPTYTLPRSPLRHYLHAQTYTRGVSQVLMPPYEMGSSGHRVQPRESPQEAYIHLTGKQSRAMKPIVYVDHAWPQTHVHSVRMFPRHDKFHIPPSLLAPHALPQAAIGLAHYRMRSWEELVRKLRASRNSVTVAVPPPTTFRADKPRRSHLYAPKRLRYTHFRAAYRVIMRRRLTPPVLRRVTDTTTVFNDRPRLRSPGTRFVSILTPPHASTRNMTIMVPRWKNWFNWFPPYHTVMNADGVTCCRYRNGHVEPVFVNSEQYGTTDAASILTSA